MQKYLPILRARRERRLAQERAAAARARGTFLSAGMLLSALMGAIILLAAFLYADLTSDLPSIEILPRLFNPPNGILLEPTRMYDRSGTELLAVFAPQNAPRRYIPIHPQNPQHIPEDMLTAIVAAQDPGFWRHGGYSPQGWNDPRSHPTLAQKLVYDFILYEEVPSVRRAIRERILAAQITAQFGRTQILEWYLNSADFGSRAYGIESAAQLYFGKPAAQLTLAESVILAAASEAPALNPLDAEKTALQRGRELIYVLHQLGRISSERAANALIETPRIQPKEKEENVLAPAFQHLVITQIESFIPRARLLRGGLNIITTLDADLQRQAQCLTETYAARIASQTEPAPPCESARFLPIPPDSATLIDSSASAIILDPNSGEILALVGETRNGKETPLVSAHPAGSALDSFVYLAAFTRGFSPASLVWDVPSPSGAQNFDGAFHGPARMRVALENDYQIPLENLRAQMGAENIAHIESSFDIQAGQPASMVKIAGAYGVFATQGAYFGREINGEFTPITALRVEDANRVRWLDWEIPQSKSVLTSALAYLMTHALSDESIRAEPRLTDIGRLAGVKQGQNADGRDAWTVGYTPAREVAVWTGAPEGSSPLTPRVTAGLWSALMRLAEENLPASGWSAPQGVTKMTVCDPSGMLPTRECPRLVSEVFLLGNEPTQADTLYREVEINRETNLLATVFTPPEFIEKRVYLIAPEEARGWAMGAGVEIPPASYDAIQAPPLVPNVSITAPALFSEVSGKVRIIGTASGADFESYRVQVGAGLNPQAWTQVGAEGLSAVENGTLAEWDTQGKSGLYAIRLLVLRGDQRIDTVVIQVTVK